MRIILDGMGGDNAPLEIVKGAVEASKLIDESVTGVIGPMITKFRAETIDINNGLLIISGRKY